MIRAYAVAIGHNNSAGLVRLQPQPRTPGGLQYPETLTAADGSVIEAGAPLVEMVFSALEDRAYTAILAQFGLTTAASREVTVRLRDALGIFRTYNGIASQPPGKGRAMTGWESVTILITHLERI